MFGRDETGEDALNHAAEVGEYGEAGEELEQGRIDEVAADVDDAVDDDDDGGGGGVEEGMQEEVEEEEERDEDVYHGSSDLQV